MSPQKMAEALYQIFVTCDEYDTGAGPMESIEKVCDIVWGFNVDELDAAR
jgi:hypothetical protein